MDRLLLGYTKKFNLPAGRQANNQESVMLEKKWIPVTKTVAITFSLCTNSHCAKLNVKHGCVELITLANGYVSTPFCCFSQSGVTLAVANLKLAEGGWKRILDLPEVKELPVELTEHDKPLLDSSSEMEKFSKRWVVRRA